MTVFKFLLRTKIDLSSYTSYNHTPIVGEKRTPNFSIDINITKVIHERKVIGENGSAVLLTDEEEKEHKLHIDQGYKNFAFNEYISNQISVGEHSSSKATKNESSCPDEIPLQMLPMGIWGPENMKIENI